MTKNKKKKKDATETHRPATPISAMKLFSRAFGGGAIFNIYQRGLVERMIRVTIDWCSLQFGGGRGDDLLLIESRRDGNRAAG